MEFAVLKGPWQIERMIDEFMDQVSESGMAFEAGLGAYLESGASEQFAEKLGQVDAIETRADALRRSILADIFRQTLIPEARADVMALLNELDSIINQFEAVLYSLDGERPQIPAELTRGYSELTQHSVASVEALVRATRVFLRDPGSITDEGHKVTYYETEADKAVGSLRKAIFAMECELALKLQLVSFMDQIVWTSDQAEDTFDQLKIFALKRVL